MLNRERPPINDGFSWIVQKTRLGSLRIKARSFYYHKRGFFKLSYDLFDGTYDPLSSEESIEDQTGRQLEAPYTVHEVLLQLKTLVTEAFPYTVRVVGETSSLSIPASGLNVIGIIQFIKKLSFLLSLGSRLCRNCRSNCKTGCKSSVPVS